MTLLKLMPHERAQPYNKLVRLLPVEKFIDHGQQERESEKERRREREREREWNKQSTVERGREDEAKANFELLPCFRSRHPSVPLFHAK